MIIGGVGRPGMGFSGGAAIGLVQQGVAFVFALSGKMLPYSWC